MDIRAICTDIDGTLLDKNRGLSIGTIETIGKVKDKAVVILASSRMPSAMRYLQKELGIENSPLICYNGGYIITCGADGKEHVLDSKTIEVSICERIAHIAQQQDIHVSLYEADNWYAPRLDEWTQREINNTRIYPTLLANAEIIATWKTENSAGAHKIMCMGHADKISTLYHELAGIYADDLYLYLTKPTYLEIATKQSTKASALKLLLGKLYDFDESSVMAFGDNHNDVHMLEAAGLGIAVGNARQEVKDKANEVTLNSTDDGVAIAIRKHFNL